MKNCAQTRALAVIAITLAAALSACGSTGSSGSSTSSTSTKSPSAAATNAASGDPNLVFAQCMREKGFTPENLKDTSDAFNSALNECMDKVSGMTGDDSVVNDQAARETLVKGAECLRGLGYDVKDPDASGGINLQDIPQDAINKCFTQTGAAK